MGPTVSGAMFSRRGSPVAGTSRPPHAGWGVAGPAASTACDRPWDRAQRRRPANVLDRQFTASAPNQKWVADFTYLWTAEGWLYVAVVLDLFSRRVVGWSMQATMTSRTRHRGAPDGGLAARPSRGSSIIPTAAASTRPMRSNGSWPSLG